MNEVLEAPRAAHAFSGLAAPLAEGTVVRGCRVEGIIGRGGFGVVYRAIDLRTGEALALKEYLPAQLAARRDDGTVEPLSPSCAEAFEAGRLGFLEEGALLRSLRDPGLVEVSDAWAQDGTGYLAMRLYEGPTLERVIAATPGGMSADALRTIVEPLLGALSTIHVAGRIHRDVSPDNVIVQPGGAAVLLDLGTARRAIGDHVRATTVMLKSGYAPIEQYGDDPECPVGPWSDVYALGAVLHHAATGEPPPASPLRMMRDTRVPLAARGLPGIDAGFAEAVDAAMAVHPEERPRTITEFAVRLGLADGQGRPPFVAGGRAADPPRRRHHPAAVAGALAGALLFAASITAWLLAGAPPSSDPAGDALSQVPGQTAGPAGPAGSAGSVGAVGSVDPAEDRSAGGSQVGTVATDPRPKAGADGGARAPAARAASLKLAVSPWAEVWVDGARRGVTPPMMAITLSPGSHRIELRNPAAAPVVRTVEVRAGQSVELMHRFDMGAAR
jgi:hypothetical protein